MLKRLNKNIMIITIAILTILTINTKVEASDFNTNLELIQDKQVSAEDEKTFIKADKNYLENADRTEVRREIQELEKELKQVKNDYITSSNGIKIYTANTSLKNNAVRTAIKNRENLLKGSNFKYDETTKYMMDRDYQAERYSSRHFSQKDMDLALESIKETVENIEMDTDFLKNTTFVVSPYVLDGINGYTVSRSNGKSTVVLANHVFGASEEWIKQSMTSTTLHEMGHVFYNNNQKTIKTNQIAKQYFIEEDKELSDLRKDAKTETGKWKTSSSENFAEDFRTHFSTRLGNKSFDATAKKTVLEYDEMSFAKVLEALK